VDPLRCPACGGEMQIIRFIDKCQADADEKILRHCGLWKACPEFDEGRRHRGCRRQSVAWQTVSRAMITVILIASAFKESFLNLFLRKMISQRCRLFTNFLEILLAF